MSRSCTTPVKAIRAKCIECSGGKIAATKCDSEDCPLFPYRTGHNPARIGCGPALSTESAKNLRRGVGKAISARGITTQDVKVSGKSPGPHGSTPETVLGQPRAKSGQPTFPPPVLLPRRVLGKAVEAFVRELREGGVWVEDQPEE